MKPEFINTIRDNYRQDQEFIQKRYLSSCLTERAKLGIGKFDFTVKKKKNVKTQRKEEFKMIQARTVSALSGEPARILYNNRRAGSIELLLEGEKSTKMSLQATNPSFELPKPAETIFKTNLVFEEFD